MNTNAQEIPPSLFNKIILNEEFEKESTYFPIIVDQDNYFVLDKGDYLLSRHNTETEHAIIARTNTLKDFLLKTKIRLGPSRNSSSSIGIILKAQTDGSGAVIIELNANGEYRIKQLIDSTYTFLSAKNKDDGWRSNKIIKEVDEYNIVEIRSSKNIYELYINDAYITSISIPKYTEGLFGLIISANTKARIGYYLIKEKGEEETSISSTKALKNIPKNTLVIDNNATLNQKIISLQYTIKGNNRKIEELETKLKIAVATIKELKTENKNLISKSTNNNEEKLLSKKNQELTKQINQLKTNLKEIEIRKNTKSEKDNLIRIAAYELKEKNIELESLKKECKNQKELLQNLQKKNIILSEKNISYDTIISNIKKELNNQEQINQELKDIFVYKDFELNGLKTSTKPSSIRTTYPAPRNLDGTTYVYAVQIGAYEKKMDKSHFRMIKNLSNNQLNNGVFVYLSGKFTSVKDAAKHQREVKRIGYKYAFIVKIER